MLAATRAPNAINRITSVIGSEVTNTQAEILADRFVELLADARVADLLDRSNPPWAACAAAVALSVAPTRSAACVLVAGDLEAKQRGMPVGCDLSGVAGLGRGSRMPSYGEPQRAGAGRHRRRARNAGSLAVTLLLWTNTCST